ncbi:hypothetical protein K7432_016291 [Basidiobolus ranarum]|uniref:Uncharacterized protein n=1 Tax=Basidiobolus ranarum TaxID=34480 RepID=A0ABR2VLX2_9FUNG
MFRMYLKATFFSAILLASLTNAADNKLSSPSDQPIEFSASNLPSDEKTVIDADIDFFVPDFMLDKEVELTPEESQMRRIN